MDLSPQVEQLIDTLGYLGVALGLYIEHVFPPAPAQFVIPIAALLVVGGDLEFWGVWAAGVVGAVLGSMTLYEVGRWGSEPIVRRFIRKYGKYLTISEHDLDRSLRWLHHYGNWAVFISHMIPISVIRVLVSVLVGVNHMRRGQFILYTTLGSILWIGAQLYVVVLLGDNWAKVDDMLRPYEPLVWGAGFVLGVVCVVWYVRRLRRQMLDS